MIDEAALRRPIGGADVMRAQLRHLPGIDVRVLPADFALHPGLDGPFWLFRMPTPYPPVGYQHGLAGDLYIELPERNASSTRTSGCSTRRSTGANRPR